MQGYSGLRAQDLQEAKDQLLVETSDMLHVPLFTAEALLRNHGTVTCSAAGTPVQTRAWFCELGIYSEACVSQSLIVGQTWNSKNVRSHQQQNMICGNWLHCTWTYFH